MGVVLLTMDLLLGFQMPKESVKKCDARPQVLNLGIRNNLRIATAPPCFSHV